MENTVNERIKKLIRHFGFSISAYSKEIGIAQTTLNNQIKGGSVIGVETLLAILSYNKEISAEWLMRGVGDMLLSENTKKDIPTSLSDLEKDEENKTLKERNLILEKEVSYLEGQVSILIGQSSKKEDREGKSA